jgi:hypothetical protein
MCNERYAEARRYLIRDRAKLYHDRLVAVIVAGFFAVLATLTEGFWRVGFIVFAISAFFHAWYLLGRAEKELFERERKLDE